jgi:hypothetical protein
VLALVEAICKPLTRALLLSRSFRQSTELFRTLTGFFRGSVSPPSTLERSGSELA